MTCATSNLNLRPATTAARNEEGNVVNVQAARCFIWYPQGYTSMAGIALSWLVGP